MARGRLRVYLSPAPGAGATFRMLEEGNRRRGRGSDVVVGVIDLRDRAGTSAQVGHLEVVGCSAGGGLDVAAVLARRPAVVLVDDIATTNAAGARNPARWDDVRDLLDSGIDVITTVDIAQLQSVRDVVERITGQVPPTSIPDAVIREADQVELVDITPEALRRRLAHGNIYPADRIDATLSNYFRVGNLSALRQLAMLWVADRIGDSLSGYLDEHHIDDRWETRERLVVGITGSDGDEVVLRRAARLAARSRSELVAVHVVGVDHRAGAEDMARTRDLVRELGGVMHEIVDDDVAVALVAFARQERGTQVVIGSHGSRRLRRLRGSVASRVLRDAHDLDVHIIATDSSRPATVPRRQKSPFTWRRRGAAVLGGGIVFLGLTLLLTALHPAPTLSAIFVVYLVPVAVLTAWGGAAVGVGSAAAAAILENYYFVSPTHTLAISRSQDIVTLCVFLGVSLGVTFATNGLAKRTAEVERARSEAEILAKAAATAAISRDDLEPLLDSLRAIFDLRSATVVHLVDGEWIVEQSSGAGPHERDETTELRIDEDHRLRLAGAKLDTHDRALLAAFAERLGAALQVQRVQRESLELRALAETDALRTGLLRAVSHDLRTPLSSIEANVSSLLARDIAWSPTDQRAFLLTIERETHRLTRLVTNLLDASRLEAGVVTPRTVEVEIDDLVASALETIDLQGRQLDIDLPADLPSVVTDPDLYERVVANVVANACRFSPPDVPVRINAGVAPGSVDLLVIDRGPGIAAHQRDTVLAPFQRHDDSHSGAGLGLTVASGFMRLLGGELGLEDTPGGGLTVVIGLSQGGRP